MSKDTNISYVHHTFSPWIGCTKVSPGCAHCYAETQTFPRVQRSKGIELWGKGKPRHRTKNWKEPLRWNRLAPLKRERVLVSMCDWLDDEVPIEWLADFLQLIHDTRNLDWLLLTKRPENFYPRLRLATNSPLPLDAFRLQAPALIPGPPNVWLGVSCEDQRRADERIPLLLQIPAKVRWVSFEPLLDIIELDEIFGQTRAYFDWAVIGGESGKNFRDIECQVIFDLAYSCATVRIPVYVKQAAGTKPGLQGRIPDDVWSMKQFPKL